MAGLGGDGLRGWVGRLKSRRSSSTGLLLKSVVYGQANQAKKTLWNDWFFQAQAAFGNSDSDSALAGVTGSTSLVAISEVLQVRTSGTGTLYFSALLDIYPTNETTNGLYHASLLWRYRTVGGGWVDVGSEVSSTGWYGALVSGGILDSEGHVETTPTQSSLAANTNYEVQLYGHRDSSSPTNNLYFLGTASVANSAGSDVSVSVTGQALSAFQGSVSETLSLAISGLPSSVAAGSLSPSRTLGLTGQSSAIQQGAVTASTGATVSLSGIGIPASTGLLATTTSSSVSGQTASVSTGTVSAGAVYSVNLTGLNAALASGNLSGAVNKALSGQAVSLAPGTVTAVGSSTVALTGLSIQAQSGTLTTSRTNALSGVSASLGLGDTAPTSAEDAVSGIASGTSFVAVTDVLRVSSGSLGKLDFSGLLEYDVGTLTDGIYNAFAIWRYRTLGGGWADVGTEIEAFAACRVILGELDQFGEFDVTATQPGLSANTAYEVQLYVRRATTSPTNNIQMISSGTAVVVTGVADGTASITGQAVSLTSGTLTPARAVTLTGQSTAVQQQSLAATRQGNITGQAVSLSQSSVSTTNAVTVSISGQALALSQTNISIARSALLSGQSSTLTQSSVSVENGIVVTLSGQAISASRGSVTTARTLDVAGIVSSLQQGTAQTDSDIIVYLTGTSAQLNVGSLNASSQLGVAGQQSSLALGSLTSARVLGITGASVLTFIGTIGSTLPPVVVEEYDVRLFDGLRSQGNRRNPYKSVRGLEYAMWGRVLSKCEYVPYVYYASSPSTLRIGFGRPITGTEAEEELNLNKNRESVWLNSKLTEIYQRVLAANPSSELHEILTSTLYYYQAECQKSA